MRLKDLPQGQQRIFLRADLNVSLDNLHRNDNYKLNALRPTLDKILERDHSIVIATHLGRPDGTIDHKLSTKRLLPWFKKHAYDVVHIPYEETFQMKKKRICLLENVRFFKEEMDNDKHFAQKLSELADIYVNDGFGVVHRNHASVNSLPYCFSREKRFYGFQLEKEISLLSHYLKPPQQPFVVIMGGSKAATKIPLLKKLILKKENERPSHILVGGLLAYSLQDMTKKESREFLDIAHTNNVAILTPFDHIVLHDGKAKVRPVIPGSSEQGYDIGPQTLQSFERICRQAQTIFFNGTLGKYEQKPFDRSTRTLCKMLSSLNAHTIVAGGDTLSVLQAMNLIEKVSCASTGGGATLAFIADDNPFHELPGLQPLFNSDTIRAMLLHD